MFYFMGLNETSHSWTGNFTNAVRKELQRKNVPFRLLPPLDWQSTDASIVQKYQEINSSQSDSWLIGWAQSPAIEFIKDKPGHKFGMVVGLTAMPFEPAVLYGTAEMLREPQRLQLYDRLFVNSHWCKQCLIRSYPDLKDKVIVTGFPVDFNIYEKYLDQDKKDNLVVFNQRFAPEKLHVLEVELTRRLKALGYQVQHLTGVKPSRMMRYSSEMSMLMRRATEAGLEWLYNPTKSLYHQRLAKASTVVTTSIADMLPLSLIEAIYLRAVPVAPAHMCFVEFVHADNLYTPYDLNEVLSVVQQRPDKKHNIQQYRSERVVQRFLEEMKHT